MTYNGAASAALYMAAGETAREQKDRETATSVLVRPARRDYWRGAAGSVPLAESCLRVR